MCWARRGEKKSLCDHCYCAALCAAWCTPGPLDTPAPPAVRGSGAAGPPRINTASPAGAARHAGAVQAMAMAMAMAMAYTHKTC